MRLPGIDRAEEQNEWKTLPLRRRALFALLLTVEYAGLAALLDAFVVRPDDTGERIAFWLPVVVIEALFVQLVIRPVGAFRRTGWLLVAVVVAALLAALVAVA